MQRENGQREEPRLESSGEKSDVVVCRFTLPIPDACHSYCRRVSLLHPELEFEVLSHIPVGREEMVEDIRVTGSQLNQNLAEELRGTEGVKGIETLRQSTTDAVFRVRTHTCPIIKVHQELQIPPSFPFTFHSGIENILVVTSEAKMRELFAKVKEVIPGASLVSVRHEFVVTSECLLTPRQREFFRMAMELGYWDIPRRVSLADLARQANVAKSTFSEALASIEKKLISDIAREHLRTF